MTYEELTARVRAMESRPAREYAVLAPVAEEGGELYLLFEVRSATLRTQPGEICFPGGGIETGETAAEGALREMGEELGLRPPLVELGAPLPRLWHQAGFATQPFLARLAPGWREALDPGRDEVAETFLVPLDFFRRTQPELYLCETTLVVPDNFPYDKIGFPQGGYPWRRGKLPVPLWQWGDKAIWGFTARIVLELVKGL